MPPIPLQDQVEIYLSFVERKRSPATRYLYGSVMERIFLPWALGAGITTASLMSDQAMETYTTFLQGKKQAGYNHKPLSEDTVRSYIRYLKTFLHWAQIPRGHYESPKRPKRRLRDVLSREEIQQMEDAAPDERDRLIIRVLGDTGVRVGELLGLRLQDLHENTHSHKHYIRVGGGDGGKGDSEREVPVPAPVFKRLKRFGEMNHTEFIFMGKRRRANGKLEALTTSGVDQMVRNLAKTAEIEKRVFPHLFRHSYITHMRRKGIDSIDVMHAVGHRTLAMISEIYDQTTPDDSHDELIRALK